MRRPSFRYATVSAAACYPEAPTLPIGVLDELEVVFCEKARSGDGAFLAGGLEKAECSGQFGIHRWKSGWRDVGRP
jgi:hypothetical protein